ncbi:hypothetical protein GCM10027614_13840 [Micromonospora vulcania]
MQPQGQIEKSRPATVVAPASSSRASNRRSSRLRPPRSRLAVASRISGGSSQARRRGYAVAGTSQAALSATSSRRYARAGDEGSGAIVGRACGPVRVRSDSTRILDGRRAQTTQRIDSMPERADRRSIGASGAMGGARDASRPGLRWC